MKKVIFSLLVITVMGFVAGKVNAQTTGVKIGYFDSEQMAGALPEAKDVQAKMDSYQRDSLGHQRDQLDTALTIAQNAYQSDSLAKKSAATLNYDRQKLNEAYQQLVGWQQTAQNLAQQKYYTLMQPLFKKVNDALVKACTDNHITVVLKTDAIDGYVDQKQVVNMFIPVAKILGITLPNQNATNPNNAAPGGN